MALHHRLGTSMALMVPIVPLALSCLLSSCTFPNEGPNSQLIIAVDVLPFGTVECEDEESPDLESGFSQLCMESVRFTHAYTPSVLSQPALTSILTGLYPFEHGVTNNGRNFLSARFDTIAERAFQKGYHTGFFSGGPPILRKSGLGQGFEFFEDNIDVNHQTFHRPVRETFRLFLDWMKREVGRKPFLSVIYVPDLRYRDLTTHNDAREARESSYRGQFQELDESLAFLIEQLKKEGVWPEVSLYLVGLNGDAQKARVHEALGQNLFGENSLVTVFIKPARKIGDRGTHWTVDTNISLVDVGTTIFDSVDKPVARLRAKDIPTDSLKSLIVSNQHTLSNSRRILIESGFPSWQGYGGRRVALVQDHYFILYENPPRVYNTLIDRTFALPMDVLEARKLVSSLGVESLFSTLGYEAWSVPENSTVQKYEIAQDLWSPSLKRKEIEARFDLILKARPNDFQILAWRALVALENEDWTHLASIGEQAQVPAWVYVADKNLGLKATLPQTGCFRLFNEGAWGNRPMETSFKICENELTLKLWQWLKADPKGQEADARKDIFLRSYNDFLLDRWLAKINYRYGKLWDVSDAPLDGPSDADLILSLPEYRSFRQLVPKHSHGD